MKLIERSTLVVTVLSAAVLIVAATPHVVHAASGQLWFDLFWFIRR